MPNPTGQKYTATLHWIYGEERWNETRGEYWVNAFYDETIELQSSSDQEAFKAAMRIARQKINESELPGRPGLGVIELILSDLKSPRGKLINLGKKDITLVRPIFK